MKCHWKSSPTEGVRHQDKCNILRWYTFSFGRNTSFFGLLSWKFWDFRTTRLPLLLEKLTKLQLQIIIQILEVIGFFQLKELRSYSIQKCYCAPCITYVTLVSPVLASISIFFTKGCYPELHPCNIFSEWDTFGNCFVHQTALAALLLLEQEHWWMQMFGTTPVASGCPLAKYDGWVGLVNC